jgi:hypothetical protein
LKFRHFLEKIAEFDGGERSIIGPTGTGAIFATYPGGHLGIIGGIIDQVEASNSNQKH